MNPFFSNLLFLSFFVLLTIQYPSVKIYKEFVTDGTVISGAHVCTIVESKDGEIIASFQGTKIGESEQKKTIWSSIRSNRIWSPVKKSVIQDECVMNPSMFYEGETGRIIMFYHKGGGDNLTCSSHSWKGWRTFSYDNGKTFQNDTELPSGYLGSVKNQCLRMSNQQIIRPTSTESLLKVGVWMSHFEFPFSNWKEYDKTKSISFFKAGSKVCQGIIQPTIIERDSGNLKAYFRSGCGVLATAESKDFGKTWPKIAKPTNIPNPNSGIDMTNMKDTDLGVLLVYNNSTKGRSPLNVAYSLDGAENFTEFLELESTPGGYFAYPFVIQSRLNKNKAYVCYTHNPDGHQRIAFVELDFS